MSVFSGICAGPRSGAARDSDPSRAHVYEPEVGYELEHEALVDTFKGLQNVTTAFRMLCPAVLNTLG